jgi:hypothetical protein
VKGDHGHGVADYNVISSVFSCERLW